MEQQETLGENNSNTKVNEDCVGPSSKNAGKASSCAGCPSQGTCSTNSSNPATAGVAGTDVDAKKIAERLSQVKNILLILSGKGGVGKSTFSHQLCLFLAHSFPSLPFALLDADICGPSSPTIFALPSTPIHSSSTGFSPVSVPNYPNLSVISSGLLLPDSNSAVIWRGPKKNNLIKQFLLDVDWGEQELLVVDTPPGTSDEHLALVSYLAACTQLRGAVVVTTPQEVALQDVRKSLSFCKKVGMNIVGVVENMSGWKCGKCGTKVDMWQKGERGGVDGLGEKVLGKIPLDAGLARACDEGEGYWKRGKESEGVKAFEQVLQNLRQTLNLDWQKEDNDDDDEEEEEEMDEDDKTSSGIIKT